MTQWYLDHYRDDPSVVRTVVVLCLAGLTLGVLAPRRRALTALVGLSLAGVLGMTLVPQGGWSGLGFTPAPLHSMLVNLQPDGRSLRAWTTTGDGPLNVLLFVPLGLFGALLTRRPVATVVLASTLSVAIECWQSSLTTRVGSLADVVCNGLGALVGAVAGALLLAVTGQRRGRAGSSARGSRARSTPAHSPAP